MLDSILNTIKKMLGIDADYDAFDTDIIIHINTELMALFQLGIGPMDEAFLITGATETWKDFIGDSPNFEAVKSLIYLKTKILFDPPSSSFALEAMNKQIECLEWRLTAQAETK